MFSKSGLRIVVGHYGHYDYKSSFGANNQQCCKVATDVNFPRKLTGLTSLVANINQMVVLVGGIDSSDKDRDEVLCGILQSVLTLVCRCFSSLLRRTPGTWWASRKRLEKTTPSLQPTCHLSVLSLVI